MDHLHCCIKCAEQDDLLADTALRIKVLVEAEREACAVIAELHDLGTVDGHIIAGFIRERGDPRG